MNLTKTVPYAAKYGWTITKNYTSSRGWCVARAQYQGKEWLSLIVSQKGWTLRVSRPGWDTIKQGGRYDVVLRTDRGWAVDYRAWGYRGAYGARGGLRMKIFPRVITAMGSAQYFYLTQTDGKVITALDLTGSSWTIGALRRCKADLARTGGYAGVAPVVIKKEVDVAVKPKAIKPLTGATAKVVAPVKAKAVDAPAPASLDFAPSELEVAPKAGEIVNLR
ncbi:MAG: hypothetical protein MRY74_05335 [Neomegalonema sp.]|nr:hypothetical protein [Neomegalonema sp.]